MESLSINDSPTLFTQQARAYYPSATPRIPPSVLLATLSKLVTNEGTWKRISRSNIGTDIVMEEAVGEKEVQEVQRANLSYRKEKKVSQVGNKSKQIFAKAGFQSCQKQ